MEPHVDFSYPDDDGVELHGNELQIELVDRLLTYCFRREGATAASYRRFVSIIFVVRPELIGSPTMRELAVQFGVSPQSVNRMVQEARILMGYRPSADRYPTKRSEPKKNLCMALPAVNAPSKMNAGGLTSGRLDMVSPVLAKITL
jgi:hypothetical protein